MGHLLLLIALGILACISLIPLGILVLGICSGPIIVRSAVLDALQEGLRRERERYAYKQGTKKGRLMQPAFSLYVVGRGWYVIGHVARYLFVYVRTCSRKWLEQAAVVRYVASRNFWSMVPGWLVVLGLHGAARVLYASSVISALLFLPLYSIALFSWLLCVQVSLTVFSLFYFAHARSIPLSCPHCYQEMAIPTYICSSCEAEHSRLWPNNYGILSHRCIRCGTNLPTTDLSGRQRLASICPFCRHGLPPRIADGVGVHIALAGATSAGKTSYLMMALHELQQIDAKYSLHFIDATGQQRIEDSLRLLKQGQTLSSTKHITPSAYTLKIQRADRRVSRVLYLYDPSGGAFDDDIQAGKQMYYKYSNGIIFVIDPFSLPVCSQKQAPEQQSFLAMMQTYERMIKTFEIHTGMSGKKRYHQPIAVVVNKIDLFGLNNEIGLPAARVRKYDPSLSSGEEAFSQLVRAFLCAQGLANLVHDLELHFANVRYFSCSALGRTPTAHETRAFEPDRALDPLLWVLRQSRVL